MFYVHFSGGTPFCGEDYDHYDEFEEEPSEDELMEMSDNYARENGESYYDEERHDMDEEDYFEDCQGNYEFIDKEEYEECC